MSYEGAMLGGAVLPEKEFIDLMSLLLKEHKDSIYHALAETRAAIEKKNFKEAYHQWDIFQTQVLKNPTISLLAILNFTSSTNQQWTFIDNEENALNKNGLINIQSVSEDLRRTYISGLLTQHLSNLFKTIKTEMEEDEIAYLYGLNKSEVYKVLNPIKYGDKIYTYQKGVYGKIQGKYLNGKVADAYVNHLGSTHSEYLNNFSKGNIDGLEHVTTTSVKDEERARNALNFIKLLMASMNRTAWYTGGDLIITNSLGQIVANIQLKTSFGAGEQIGYIRTAILDKKIKELQDLIYEDNEKIAAQFYELLKTSAQVEQLGDVIIEEAYNIAAENLGLTIH